MNRRIPTYVFGNDLLSQAGVMAQLRPRQEIALVDDDAIDDAAVGVVVSDAADEETLRTMRAIQRNGCPRVVLVAGRLDEASVFAALEAGACGFLRRVEATPSALVALVQSAEAGDGSVPPDLLGRLLRQIGHLQRQVLGPRGLNPSALTERELDVLRLVAEGFDTGEIASKLSYSDRTIKNVIHDVTVRLGLRNRTHAVVWAVREGLI